MSCNGCRVLRKGCSETCILRPCLQWIETPEAQGHATVFVAKFFGRAGLMSFISNVPDTQRPALFQSLLFEAAGRTVNPVNGAVGLLGTGNWHVCQAAVETVLRGGALKPIPELITSASVDADEASECTDMLKLQNKRRSSPDEPAKVMQLADLDLSLTPGYSKSSMTNLPDEKRRHGSPPSMNSEESLTTTCGDDRQHQHQHQQQQPEIKLLNLFN